MEWNGNIIYKRCGKSNSWIIINWLIIFMIYMCSMTLDSYWPNLQCIIQCIFLFTIRHNITEHFKTEKIFHATRGHLEPNRFWHWQIGKSITQKQFCIVNMNSEYYSQRFETVFLHLHSKGPKLSLATTAKYIPKPKNFMQRSTEQWKREKKMWTTSHLCGQSEQPHQRKMSKTLSCLNKVRECRWTKVSNA